jgi:phosphate-selective porin OprO/OprP
MKLSKLKFVVAIVLGTSISSGAFAIDLYVNTKTKQIYSEPGPERELLGSFERVEDAPTKTATPVLPPRNRSAELQTKAENARLVSKVDSLEERIKKTENIKVTLDKKGLQFKTTDENFKFKIGGRIQADASVSGNDKFIQGGTTPVEANNGTEIRRGRLAFSGTFFKDWNFISEIDFADNNVTVKDMKLNYSGLNFINATVGQQKQAFSRELQESSNDLMFIERSLMNVLNEPVVDRAIGVNLASHGKKWTGQAGVYGESIKSNKTSMDEGWGVSGRATYTPIAEETKLVHLGIAGNFREPSDAGQISGSTSGASYSYETTHMSDLFPINSGVITSINNIKMLGLEANGVYGPFSVGGEYTHSWMDRKMGMKSLGFHGWYGEASWTLTGESRKYTKGKFKRLEPAREFSFANGGLGAWELAARVAGVDLNDGTIKGGTMKNFSVALNWYANSNVRFMFGYDRIIDIKNSPLTTRKGGKPDGLNTFMFRSQIAF